MQALAVAHNSIILDIAQAVAVVGSGTAEYIRQDAIWDEGTIPDPDTGLPLYYRRFVGLGSPYTVIEAPAQGGFSVLGQRGNWSAILISSSGQRLQQIATQAGSNLIPLATKAPGQDWADMDVLISAADAQRMQSWAAAQGLRVNTEGATTRRAVRRILAIFGVSRETDNDLAGVG